MSGQATFYHLNDPSNTYTESNNFAYVQMCMLKHKNNVPVIDSTPLCHRNANEELPVSRTSQQLVSNLEQEKL